ncbi:hypothetical protein FC697_00845 [Bacillus wiedmannii]|uniref:DUF6414 family protein n=1 Tax=Bacillus wiedmannii TaxID=1890302 RepID=UPI0010BDD9BD|nr:DUF6414 family protein [Bacillus wiedmannii]TKH27396.1 hypothetical protein FC697_00845 [Bacillus wiedmannii]
MKKVIYFDDASVTDFLQIEAGGQLQKTTELLKQSGKFIDAKATGELKVEPKQSLISSALSALVGFSASVKGNINVGASAKTDKMAKSIIQNTILTDFMDYVKTLEQDDNSIKRFKNYNLSTIKDSLAYIVMVSPYMRMIDGKINVGDEGNSNFDIVTEKIDETIKNAKGYYEFIAESAMSNPKKVILRFNIAAFRNNYKITDLIRMELVFLAIYVGKSREADLSISNELNVEQQNSRNPNYESSTSSSTVDISNTGEDTYDMYDVLLAGVE